MLTIKNLVKTYPKSDRIAVDNISFELRPGEIFGFLGQNGAGKSTTIKCLTGILPFDSGTIEICGYDIVKEPIKAKMQMGYVPDNHSVYEKLTGREYVNYVADLYKVPSDVRAARLERFAKLFRLDFAIDRQIKSYSHGMKQKICIIAALIHEPKLWVLDEPMMGLDPQSIAEIIAHMREHCAKGNTVFFSSHNLDLVKRLCHRVAIVNEGKLLDLIELENNEENKANLEEKFFRITGTYNPRLFEDYIAQESSDMRPDMPVKSEEVQEQSANDEKQAKGIASRLKAKLGDIKIKIGDKKQVDTAKGAEEETIENVSVEEMSAEQSNEVVEDTTVEQSNEAAEVVEGTSAEQSSEVAEVVEEDNA